MLNPQFVAGEHGLFGGHKSEDIRTFLNENMRKIFAIFTYNNNEIDIEQILT